MWRGPFQPIKVHIFKMLFYKQLRWPRGEKCFCVLTGFVVLVLRLCFDFCAVCVLAFTFVFWLLRLCFGICVCVLAFAFVFWHLRLCFGFCVCVLAFAFWLLRLCFGICVCVLAFAFVFCTSGPP